MGQPGVAEVSEPGEGGERSPPPLQGRYRLRADAFFCISGAFAVFLSLAQNRYWCVSLGELCAAAPWLYGWSPDRVPSVLSEPLNATPEGSAKRTCALLLRNGVLDEPGPIGKPVMPTLCMRASRDFRLAHWTVGRHPCRTLGLRRHAAFWNAVLRAEFDLRWRSLAQVVARIDDWKESHGVEPESSEPRSPSRATLCKLRRAVREFQALRAWHVRGYRCLFDSLALLYYLQNLELTATWVFGVCSEPFEAHCWLQSGAVVLNDSVDRVASYTPILQA